MEDFKRINLGLYGSVNNPEILWSEEIYCSCNSIAKITRKEPQSYTYMTNRGKLRMEWDRIFVKCPKCNKTGFIDGDRHEKDVGFYSMSQPDG